MRTSLKSLSGLSLPTTVGENPKSGWLAHVHYDVTKMFISKHGTLLVVPEVKTAWDMINLAVGLNNGP